VPWPLGRAGNQWKPRGFYLRRNLECLERKGLPHPLWVVGDGLAGSYD